MSPGLLARLRAVALDTRAVAAAVPADWREPFRVTDYYRPAELVQRCGRKGF